MIIIVNREIPELAKMRLEEYGDILYFESDGVTYPEISGHADVFFCKVKDSIVIAPNTPDYFKKLLKSHRIKVIEGKKNIRSKYPETAHYNAVVTDDYYIHNLDISDSKLIDLCSDKKMLHVNQAYTRCNLLPLKNNRFITSDRGIYNTLSKSSIEVFYTDPGKIILPGFNNGFFGGACGVFKSSLFIIGQLGNLDNGQEVAEYITTSGNSIIELYKGPIFDAGSLIFIDNKV